MGTADHVIGKFGGQSALARMLGKRPSMVQYWSKAGTIPARWHEPLLTLAREHGIDLTPSDLIDSEPDTADSPSIDTSLPTAQWTGVLTIGDSELPVYVLDNGQRVISRTGATATLIGPQGGGNLESYLQIRSIRDFMPPDYSEQLIPFNMPGVVNFSVYGMTAETFLEVCAGYVRARDADALTTARQREIARRAGEFLAACAKIGLIALIDEATGYQYAREEDALRLKLKLYLEDHMRKWEKTFPDELWKEFGRLTNWQGHLHERPKYWGKLVMELIYGYLDPDVAEWLKKNNPKPQRGKNYHQWLSEQYGLKKLIEHLWMVVGMASACHNMPELRRKMAEKYGRIPVQQTLFLPPPSAPRLPARRKKFESSSPGYQIAANPSLAVLNEAESAE